MTPTAEMLGTLQQTFGVDHDLVALNAGFQRNWIAASRLADGRNVDGGGTVLAHYVAAILIVTLAPANPAGIESDGDGLIRPLDGDDADCRAVRLDRKTVQHAVVHRADRYADNALRYRERHGCRKLSRGFGVDELGRNRQYEDGRRRAGRQHPHALAPRR